MGPPSAPLLKWRVPWWGLLLTVSLLSFWNLPATAGLKVESMPLYVAEGKNVLLTAHDLPANPVAFRWFKWENMLKGSNQGAVIGVIMGHEIARYSKAGNSSYTAAYSKRATLYTNGSLLLKNVMENDAGTFILETTDEIHGNIFTIGQFFVRKPVIQPSIEATDTTVAENGSVVFTCLSGGPGISTRWILNNQSLKLTERMTLSQNSNRLSIEPVKAEDAGNYQCEVSNLASSEKSHQLLLAVNTK